MKTSTLCLSTLASLLLTLPTFAAELPFFVKGVTYGIDFREDRLETDFTRLQDLGANTIRVWDCNDAETPQILDMAQKHGLKVLLGIWMKHGRPGAEGDESFDWVNDAAGREKQMQKAMHDVEKYKDHPAVLAWDIGNEVTLNIATEPEKIAYAKFLETVCAAVKKADPKHLIASSSAWSTDWPYWDKYCPSIDIYGINTYGPGAGGIPAECKRLGIKKPYLVTEFGARGEWDAPVDKNGLKMEPDDQEKYDAIAKGWGEFIEKNKPQCAGGFVFNYGDKVDHAGIWLALMADKAFRPSYWATRKAFTGKSADNQPPRVRAFEVKTPESGGKAGEWTDVRLDFKDLESEPVTVEFYYNHREGSRADRDAVRPLEWKAGDSAGKYQIKLPNAKGVIKVYAFLWDTYPNLSIPITSVKVQ